MPKYDNFHNSGFQINGFIISEALYATNSTQVFRAIRERDQAPVILRSSGEHASASQIARLSSSAEILQGFDHPNIVKVLEVIEHIGLPCLVLEDTGSVDLYQYFTHHLQEIENQQVPLESFLNITIQLADALSVIHHGQVIHKDLHPGNIVINPNTLNVQIIDFGLASLLSREQPALAPPENLEGVMSYISPEQTGRMNRSLDYRSDFYTLGATLYQLLTGRLPFVADDAMGLVHAHIARLQVPACDVRSDVPKAVSDIIDKLMNKTAEGRYQSALGLKQDLEVCRRHVVAGDTIPDFVLGLHDISDRFQVPQVLYGREQEVQALMGSFYRASAGQPQLLAVEGSAGIGKSALIHEIHKPIAAHSGIFISGKFDQFHKNTPYSALKQALSGWMQHALSLKDDNLLTLRVQLNNALGANARVLIDFMAIFEVLLGERPPVATLGAQETQNRFHLVIQRFIQEITCQRPLVIFIDDLQWADRGTLNLLPQLIGSDTEQHICRLLVLVAYRDNEVNDYHPAMQTLKQIQTDYPNSDKSTEKSTGKRTRTLTLHPLACEHINQLLVDALHQTPQSTLALAGLIEQKTGGNPFFINEFLKTLYSERLLNFDLKQQRWLWSLNAIKAQGITSNVVELMLDKMHKLPDKTQALLQLSSCIGSLFDLQTLSIISQQAMSSTVRTLWPALKEGLLLQEGGDWLLGLVESSSKQKSAGSHEHGDKNSSAFSSSDSLSSSEAQALKLHLPNQNNSQANNQLTTRISPLVPHCRFLHDRMLQAAYQSLPEQARQQAHLDIGRLLLKHVEQDEQSQAGASQRDQQLFALIEQLNQGRALIENPAERVKLAQLNLQAAEKAKLASVWEAAVDYAEIGLSLLVYSSNASNEKEHHWQHHYALSFGLYHSLAECLYLSGDVHQSEVLYNTLLANTQSDLDKAKICAARLVQTIGRGEWRQGIDYGLSGLHYLDIKIPTEAGALKNQLKRQTHQFEKSLQARPLSEFSNLPQMTDPRLLVASSIIPNLSQNAYITGELEFQKCCILFGLNMTLASGKSDLTPVLLACYAINLVKEGIFSCAYEAAEQAIYIADLYPSCRELANTNNILAGLVMYLKSPYRDALRLHQQGYELGMENGEIARAALNFCNMLFLKVSQSDNLNVILKHAALTLALVKRKAIFFPVPIITKKFIQALIEAKPEGMNALDNEQFESDYLAKIEAGFHITYLLHYRSQLAFWYDETERATEVAAQVQAQINLMPKFSFYIDHLIQYGLLLLAQCSKQYPPLSAPSKQSMQANLDFCQSKLQALAELYPPNFEHKYLLFQAEQARIQSKHQGHTIDEVSTLYERAIDSAEQYGFLQYQALAHELYAGFWLQKKRPRYAELHLSYAIALYQRWGCTIKVKHLQERYQELFSDKHRANSEATNPAISVTQNTTQSTTQITAQISTQNSAQTRMRGQSTLDFSTLIKSTQAISGELSLKTLVAKVMQAILENSGAQHAALVLESPQGPMIEARLKIQSSAERGYDIQLESTPLNNATDLPVSLIAYVLRTKTEQVLQSANEKKIDGDALTINTTSTTSTSCIASEAFIADPYLQAHQPKSVVCLPVSYRDKLLGALYLDNQLTENAFPQARFDVTKMLLTQAAISFENARLFNEVSELNIGLEEKVEQRTAELQAANEALESFSYSVSHDLRSPLRMIKSFSTIIAQDYHDELSPEAQILFKKVIKGGEQMEELITGLLDLARLEQKALTRERLNLSDMATNIIKAIREQEPQRQASIHIEADIQVSADKRMLYSVLENLLNNAWKYSSKSEQTDIRVTRQQRANKTVYCVQDQGAGFDMTHNDKLFATFQRLHTAKEFTGTGVGLATVKRVIEKHGGEIWAESEVGQGASFYFTLAE